MSLPKFTSWLIPFLIISGIGLIVGFFILSLSGNIEGREFSPDNFSIRRFSYNKVPYLDWVLSRKRTEDETIPIQQELIDLGLLPTSTAQNWHLISESNLSKSLLPPESDARFLTHYLELEDSEYTNVFLKWTLEHPDLAPLFWPHVIEMARQESYLKISEIMEFALTDCPKNPNEFSDELKTLIAQAYLELAEIDYHLGRIERAKVRLQLSLDAESSVEAQTLLDEVSNSGVKETVQ
jgi:hypothetical protein